MYTARRRHGARFYLALPAFQPLLALPSSHMKPCGKRKASVRHGASFPQQPFKGSLKKGV